MGSGSGSVGDHPASRPGGGGVRALIPCAVQEVTCLLSQCLLEAGETLPGTAPFPPFQFLQAEGKAGTCCPASRITAVCRQPGCDLFLGQTEQTPAPGATKAPPEG